MKNLPSNSIVATCLSGRQKIFESCSKLFQIFLAYFQKIVKCIQKFYSKKECSNKPIKEIAEKIWMMGNAQSQPVLIISGGIHGNEQTGIHVVERLLKDFKNGSLMHTNGAIYLVLGNLKAIAIHERWSNSHIDLNRCFTTKLPEDANMSYEARRAQTIMRTLDLEHKNQKSVVGIDIHSTNKPSEPFIVSQQLPGAQHQHILQYLHSAKNILCDPGLVFEGSLVTMDEYFAQRGVGLCYETGLAHDLSHVETIYREILTVGSAMGVLQSQNISVLDTHSVTQHVFILRQAILLTNVGFEYAPSMGEYNFQAFQNGDCIGYFGNEPLIASFDGVILFPTMKQHQKLDKPVGYLAEQIS